jgi:aspartyl/asparaginyl-tRNA synthetase
MTVLDNAVAPAIQPPRTWGNEEGAFITSLNSPWYALIGDLQDLVLFTTMRYARSRGVKSVHLPMTTRTITCPSALGSDSQPVPVTASGVDTYLPDSSQFLLEYAMRVAPGGCWSMMQSFRGEQPDKTHLNQYMHSEAEIPGGLNHLIDYVEGYVKTLAAAVLDTYGDRLRHAIGDVSHLTRMAGHSGAFERLTFEEAARILDHDPSYVRDEGSWRTLTRKGEQRLLRLISEFVWVTHFDHLSVPFYQAFGDDERRTAANADLFFGMGEVVGSGERHADAVGVREALELHNVPERDYAWYAEMKEKFPMRTAGFGMGVERFLMWVLNHDDIRDIPLISRVDETGSWPTRVHRP